jgi:hypothetical protein
MIINYLAVAQRVAKNDGQIDWDSLPDLMKYEYEQQVDQVMRAVIELKQEEPQPDNPDGAA